MYSYDLSLSPALCRSQPSRYSDDLVLEGKVQICTALQVSSEPCPGEFVRFWSMRIWSDSCHVEILWNGETYGTWSTVRLSARSHSKRRGLCLKSWLSSRVRIPHAFTYVQRHVARIFIQDVITVIHRRSHSHKTARCSSGDFVRDHTHVSHTQNRCWSWTEMYGSSWKMLGLSWDVGKKNLFQRDP